MRKAIKATQEMEAHKVIQEIEAMGEKLEKEHHKQLKEGPYKIATGSVDAYRQLNELSMVVSVHEGEVVRLNELALDCAGAAEIVAALAEREDEDRELVVLRPPAGAVELGSVSVEVDLEPPAEGDI